MGSPPTLPLVLAILEKLGQELLPFPVPPPCPPSSLPPSDTISSPSATPTWLRTEDKLTESSGSRVTSTLLSPGELDVLSLVFLEFPDLVPPELDRLLSVTCAERDACSPPSVPGESGTERLTPTRRDTPLPPPSLPPLVPLSSSPEDTESSLAPSSPLLPMSTLLSPPVPCSPPSPPSEPVPISPESVPPRPSETDRVR